MTTFDELIRWIEPDWHRDALCREYPHLSWFPISGQPSKQVVAVCAACAVRGECLADALANDVRYGVWGALTTQERLRLNSVAA